jgi:hypothetical protein
VDSDAKFFLALVVVGAVVFLVVRWFNNLGRQVVGNVPSRIDHIGKYAWRSRIHVLRRLVSADIPEVELRLGPYGTFMMPADEARRMADLLEEAAGLADDV